MYFILLYKQQCLAKEQVTERNRGGRGRRRPTKQLFHVGALQKSYFTTHSLACFPVRQTLPDLHPPENSHTDISPSPRLPQHRTSRGLHISLKLPRSVPQPVTSLGTGIYPGQLQPVTAFSSSLTRRAVAGTLVNTRNVPCTASRTSCQSKGYLGTWGLVSEGREVAPSHPQVISKTQMAVCCPVWGAFTHPEEWRQSAFQFHSKHTHALLDTQS